MGDLDAVRNAVAFVCELDRQTLGAQTSFESIGADSLVRVGVADVVERELSAAEAGWRIDDATLAKVATLGELARHVHDLRSTNSVAS